VRNKRMDVLIHCIHRYEELTSKRPKFNPHGPLSPEEKAYFRRLWAIKREQIDFWIDGFVEPGALLSWFMGDVDYFSGRNAATITRTRYRLGWADVRDSHGFINDEFKSLIDAIANRVAHWDHLNDRKRQEALLFCLLQRLERRERKSIKRRRGNGMGRIWFKELRGTLPIEEQDIIDRELARIARADSNDRFARYIEGCAIRIAERRALHERRRRTNPALKKYRIPARVYHYTHIFSICTKKTVAHTLLLLRDFADLCKCWLAVVWHRTFFGLGYKRRHGVAARELIRRRKIAERKLEKLRL